jgi:DNA polymerase-3 subunit beta
MTSTLTRIEFTVDARPFAEAAAFAAARTPAVATQPILAGVLLTVTDGVLTVSAYDHDVYAAATLNVPGAADGQVLVSGRLLAKVADTFRKPIELTTNGTVVTITSGAAEVELPMMPVEDYPAMPGLPPCVATANTAALTRAIKRTAPFASKELAVPWLRGLRVRIDDDVCELVATDRYRAAIATVPCQAEHEGGDRVEAVPPAAIIAAAASAFTGGDIRVHFGNNVFGLSTADRAIACRIISIPDETYPAIERLFPAKSGQPTIVEVAELTEVAKRADLLNTEAGPLNCTFTSEELEVRAAGRGKISDAVPCQHHGQAVTMKFKLPYLLEALASCGTPQVELAITSPREPVLVTGVGDTDYRHLVVPVRS